MHCEEFIALVAKHVPNYDRPATLSIYNAYRKDTSVDVHEYIQQNLPHEGDIKILSIIEAYGPSSYTELSSAVKWLHQNTLGSSDQILQAEAEKEADMLCLKSLFTK